MLIELHQKLEKITKTFFGGSRSFKSIDVDKSKKPVTVLVTICN